MSVRKDINGEWVDLQENLCQIGDKVVSVFSVQDHGSSQDVVNLEKRASKKSSSTLKAITAFGGDSND